MVGGGVPTPDVLRRYVEPVLRVKMAKDVIDHHQGEISKLAAVRRDALRELRQHYSVVRIADMVGLSAPQVYSLLGESPPAPGRAHDHITLSDSSSTGRIRRKRPLVDLIEELATNARMARNMAEGKTPMTAFGEVGAKFLAEDLEEAVEALEDMIRSAEQSAVSKLLEANDDLEAEVDTPSGLTFLFK